MPFTRLLAAGALALSLVLPSEAGAQAADYPNRKITFMVGFAPGGGIDTFARVLAQGLTEQFNYPIVIENRPGAASNIAARAVANAAPDGYTFLVTGNSLAINQTYYKNPGYSISELAPIAFSARDSMAIAVAAGHPARSLNEFMAEAKRKAISFGFGGSSARIASEYVFKVLGKLPATAVPYQSGAPALNALLGGHVDIVTGPIVEIFPQVQQGKLRALAVTGPKRARVLPDVPTLREAGFADFPGNPWAGLMAPPGTPAPVVDKINATVNDILRSPEAQASLAKLNVLLRPGTPAEFAAFVAKQTPLWTEMVKQSGATAQ
jgi:tripartite-type tricarboxylate transporter receptor subunit TctC